MTKSMPQTTLEKGWGALQRRELWCRSVSPPRRPAPAPSRALPYRDALLIRNPLPTKPFSRGVVVSYERGTPVAFAVWRLGSGA